MAKKWYVVHTYSGFENKVKKSLEERVRQHELQDRFGEVLIPMEVVQEMVKGDEKRLLHPRKAAGAQITQSRHGEVVTINTNCRLCQRLGAEFPGAVPATKNHLLMREL